MGVDVVWVWVEGGGRVGGRREGGREGGREIEQRRRQDCSGRVRQPEHCGRRQTIPGGQVNVGVGEAGGKRERGSVGEREGRRKGGRKGERLNNDDGKTALDVCCNQNILVAVKRFLAAK